ncbi:hypothetical protein [Albidovulum sp.]|jgi:hypothetical protein|uniref:hypothetical protein n=1 Tax=Albidovulum sp. TaxID=1872424 RepID=UPI003058EA2D
MTYRIVLFIAFITTALALGGGLAHLYAIANKLDLPVDEYFAAQRAYDGWDMLGVVLSVELTAMIAAAVLSRSDRRVFRLTLLAIALVLAAQVIFWAFTFPANRATANWTEVPENWEALRRQWEYSHLAGALCHLAAFAALVAAMLVRLTPPVRCYALPPPSTG